ncbi:MAG: nucleotide exchange factor GrpE [Methanothermobacter sp.]|nr:nucleotide exchange factor GrpE [Methanothermobacter sp.]
MPKKEDPKELEKCTRKLERLKKELSKKEDEIEEYISHLQRLQADFENYKKQREKQEAQIIEYANEKLILKLVDVLEDMERAIDNCKSLGDFKDGLNLIYRKFNNILEKEGLQRIPTKGEKFDPFKHEAVQIENHEKYKNGEIIEEISRGYILKDRIIKPSLVKVCKKDMG